MGYPGDEKILLPPPPPRSGGLFILFLLVVFTFVHYAVSPICFIGDARDVIVGCTCEHEDHAQCMMPIIGTRPQEWMRVPCDAGEKACMCMYTSYPLSLHFCS
jgi:hypothetical protein